MRKKFQSLFSGWRSFVEHGRGGSEGFPDCVCMVDGKVIFLEFKYGDFVDGVVKPRKIRPVQISWAFNCIRNGGNVRMIVGTGTPANMRLFLVKMCTPSFLGRWRKGWTSDELVELSGDIDKNLI